MQALLQKENRGWLTCIAALLLINLWCFWPFHLYFLNDDLLHIPLTNQHKFFQTNSVRPLHELLVSMDLALYGKHAYGYHITALLLHVVVCVQLFDVCLLMQTKWLKINERKALQAAFFAVVLFLIYPQASESIAWILGRTAVLSACFFMVMLRMFFKGNYTTFSYVLGSVFFAATLFTYEQSILFPFALLAVAYSPGNELMRRKQLLYISSLFITAVFYIIVRKAVTTEVMGTYEAANFLAFNYFNLAANFFRLVLRLFLNPGSTGYFIGCAIGLVFLLAVIFLSLRKKVVINKNAVWFFVAALLLCIATVLSLGISIHAFESGRYLYLPCIFLIIAISIAAVHVYYNGLYKKACVAILFFISAYWLYGKLVAAKDYKDASVYALHTNESVLNHFSASTDTLHIDTLLVSVHDLPVFRLGFKTGIKWLNNNIDTNKIVVQHMIDDNTATK